MLEAGAGGGGEGGKREGDIAGLKGQWLWKGRQEMQPVEQGAIEKSAA